MSGLVHVGRPASHVAVLEIDNPPRNVMGRAMRTALGAALDGLENDLDIRAVILTGRGGAFCSGDDLREDMTGGERPGGNVHEFGALVSRIEAFRCPVIAAIHGWCVGGGLELALGCDIRIASEEARFICAGVKVGLMASAYRLPRLIGVAAAKALLLTAQQTGAAEALRIQLVSSVHPHAELPAAALDLARMIASRAPLSVEATKRIASAALDMDPDAAARANAREIETLVNSADHKEAVKAFMARREPVFIRG